MKLLWVLGCLLCVWVCHGLPQQDLGQRTKAEECVMYRTKSQALPVMQFHQRVSVAVLPQEARPTTQLILQSSTTDKRCHFFFMAGSIIPACGKDKAAIENLEESDITELWMEVAGRTDDPASAAWDLKVVVRQGKNRTHKLFPDTGLQPPLNMWVKSDHSIIHYYFNCVTGCLFDKSVTMAPGDHTFFLRYDESFVQMTLDGGSHQYPLIDLPGNKTVPDLSLTGEETDTKFMLKPFSDSNESGLPPLDALENVKYGMKKLSINVTAAELGPAVGLTKVTVVWNEQLGDIGVLVDGSPMDGLTDYKPLDTKRKVTVKVDEEGGGLVAPCNPHFQMVACGGDEEVTKARSDFSTTTTTTTTTSSSETTPRPSTGDAIQQSQTSQQASSGWLPALFTFVVLNFIVTVAAVSLAGLLYCRSSSNKCQLTKDTSIAPAIFSKRFSTRSSTRSTQRSSQRRKTQNDGIKGDINAEENVNSETVTTPLTTPDSLANPRKHRKLSTDEFIDLSLI